MEKPTVFVRRASGIVRSASPTDAMMFNYNSVNLGYTLFLCMMVLTLPGAILVGSLILTILLIVPFLLVYAFFTAIMPRSGGDYVFVSRTMRRVFSWGPLLGFMGNASVWLAEIIFLAIQSLWVPTIYMSSAFATLGYLTGNTIFISWAHLLTTPRFSLVIALIVIIGIGLTMLPGIKFHLRFQWLLWIVGMLGAIISILVLWSVFLGGGHNAFVNAFNEFALRHMGPDAYNQILVSLEKDFNFTAMPPDPRWTLFATGALFTSFGYAYFSTYYAGEIREANLVKNQIYSMFTPVFLILVVTLLIIIPLQSIAGSVFLGGTQLISLIAAESWPLPVMPSVFFFIGLLIENPILNIIVQISGVAWNLLICAILFPMLTRCIFAWSFDRVFPEKLAAVDTRFHSPYAAVIFITILAGFLATLFTFWREATELAYIAVYGASGIMIVTAFLFVSIAAILFPFVMKDIYQVSPVSKYKVGKFPLMSIVGVASTAVMLMFAYMYFTIPELGIAASPMAQLIVATTIIVATVVYLIAKVVQRFRGIDLSIVYAQIPPE
ncbi:APC family permease [Candidatus Bathyarchaeota archaeon]|nr:APC family permease [Candidatus Bathyarchaeota archaeon]